MGCIASCIGTCCAGCCGSAIGTCCGGVCANCCKCGNASTSTRVPYLVVMFLGVVVSLVLRYWGRPMLIEIYWWSYELCDSTKCLGYGAAYRVSFTLFLFFLVHGLAMFAKKSKIHTNYWLQKVVLMITMLIITFVIPNSVFDVYAMISRFVSGVFLLLQIIILIDFAYSWHENWMSEEKDWKIPYLVCSLAFIGGSITLWVFMFQWFSDGDCVRNDFFIGWTIATGVVYLALSLWEKVNKGVLTPSVVMLYCSYLCYSSLSSDPSSCNTLKSSDTVQVVIGIAIAGFSICYAGWNLSNSRNLFDEDPEDNAPADAAPADAEMGAISKSADGDKKEDKAKADKDEEDVEETEHDAFKRKRNQKFHFVMATTSMFVAMLITNWGVSTESSSSSYDLGEATMWIKIVSQWVTILLYTWTLVAPVIFPDRFAPEE